MDSHFNTQDAEWKKRNKKTKKVEYTTFEFLTYSVIYEIYLINLWKPEYNKFSKNDENFKDDLLDTGNLIWENAKVKISRKSKNVSKNKISKMLKEQFEIFNFYKSKYNLTESESYIITLLYDFSCVGYTNDLARFSNTNQETILEIMEKFVDLGIVKEICTKDLSFTDSEKAFTLMDVEGLPEIFQGDLI